MRWRLFAFLRGFAGRRRAEAEADEELAFHLAHEIDANLARGLSPTDARRQALADLGGVAQTREAVRDVRRLGAGWLAPDLRDAIRGLARRPIASVVAIVSLALAVGAVTAVFGIVEAVYARDLSVHRPDQLVIFWRTSPDHPDENEPLPLTQFEELQRRLADVADVFAWDDRMTRPVSVDGARYTSNVNEVSGNFFSALGVKPLLGRLLDARDVATIDNGTSARVAVLDYRAWRDRFGGDRHVLGRSIVVDGTSLTIVGVTPEDFLGLDPALAPDATVPFGFNVDRILDHATPGQTFTHYVGARLKDGVRPEDAAARLQALWPSVLERTVPADAPVARRTRLLATRLHLESLRTGTLGNGMTMRTMLVRPLAQLGALGGLVLVIAAVNVATLIFIRAVSRRAELALRATLGASRGVLVRSAIVESMVISAAGTALGVLMAALMGRLLFSALLGGVGTLLDKPLAFDPRPDPRVALGMAIVAIVIGVVCALLASWRAIGRDPADALQSHARVVGSRHGVTLRGLVAIQVALALVLMAGASLVSRSLYGLSTQDPGFHPERVWQMRVLRRAPSHEPPDRTAYHRTLAETLMRVPGVRSVSFAMPTPLIGENRMPLTIRGGTHTIDAVVMLVGPDFFQTLGMTVLAGRDFAWTDDEQAPRVAIVSESLARQAFGKTAAIGQTIDVRDFPFAKGVRIVGIVNSASLGSLHSRSPRAVYIAAMQTPYPDFTLEVRTAVDPATVARATSEAVESLGFQYVFSARPLAAWKNYALRNERVVAALATFFAGLTLLLAAAGLYAQLAYAVTLRQSEIGVRMAVGAEKRDILLMILRDAGWVVLAGILIGVPAAILAARVVANLLFGLTPYDPLTLALSAVALTAVAFVAAIVPARRASRVDPVVALRVG
jgi:predicted permease